MATATFTCFPRLPLELRLMIWEEALSTLAPRTTLWVRSMTFVDPAPRPYRAGLSCKEAWRVMQRRYLQLTSPRRHGSPAPAGHARRYWIDPNKTLIHLGYCDQAVTALSSFGADTVARFKHVALVLRFLELDQALAVCKKLCGMCRDLETLVIDWRSWMSHRPPLDAYYACLPSYTGPELGTGSKYYPCLRSCLAACCRPAPRFHILGDESWKMEIGVVGDVAL